jgi:protein-S-isoprenylcysteine O-methyltransferase Ste14
MFSVTPHLMRTGGVTATGAAAGAAGAAVASGAGAGWAGAAAGAGTAGVAAAGALFVEACAPADWQPAVKATASVTAKQATHFCIRGFVFFIKFLWFCGTRFQFRQICFSIGPAASKNQGQEHSR